MITPRIGDILADPARVLVNTVNCRGVMGSGLAERFKLAYPSMFMAYRNRCERGLLSVGVMDVHTLPDGRTLVNFPTKLRWQDDSTLDGIRLGLSDLTRLLQTNHLGSVAIPALGCENGGLAWEHVEPLIIRAFDPYPAIDVHLYRPLPRR